ncbi:hypothetical protein HYG87_10755 [Methanobacterium alkalithermotolerans]|uniref:Uncharacterized protein n=1 Tax=Methanobacterium alkalithermotolerans TaxID=2731220 RepID=A0A8T8KAS1_9EURY|nr:hypothetical protein [Methanobacterium alkalithermotolerans]QUH24203.1 hypothetical protein HYG87_10755 [Methanobacterium alkalithermotolerans]
MRQGIGIIVGSSILILANLMSLGDPTFPYRIIIILGLLFSIIYGFFEYKEYYNQIAYSLILAVFLIIIWTLYFIQPFSPKVDEMIYRLETWIITLMLLGLSLGVFIYWRKKSETSK